MERKYSRRSLFVLLAAAGSFLATGARAAVCGGHGTGTGMVVTGSWLAEHATDPKLVVLAIGQKAEFEQAHIPGSVFLEYKDIHRMPKSQADLSLEMLPAGEVARVLERAG